MNLPLLANRLWLATSAPAARRFGRALANPAAAQADRLAAIVRANRDCEFGRAAGFGAIGSVESFRRRVAVRDYDEVAPQIVRMAAGERNVLTAEPVRLFELSSGSSAASKLIPYTARLKQEFQAGLAAWITSVYHHRPGLMRGPAYWSITPLTSPPQVTAGGTPIGFEEDSAYLGPLARLVESVLAVPNWVKRLAEIDTFRYVTLLFLLRAADLRVVSVWNPTFMTLLLQGLPIWWDRLLADVAHGSIRPPGGLPAEVGYKAARGLPPDPGRAEALARLDPGDLATSVRQIWPEVGLLSCWADGPAARFAGPLAGLFPRAMLQPKGLLATEAMVSLPWIGHEGHVLALTSHFLEFEEERGQLKRAHELEQDGVYGVVVTTGGGLYRYRLHDRVQVVGRVAATPCIRFLGKADRIADWFGEKLDEGFVAACIADLFSQFGLAPVFALVAPEEEDGRFAYRLYMEADRVPEDLGAVLDGLLCRNFHYDYCRKLGQLGAVRAVPVEGGAAAYLRVCQARGMKLGNIKPAVLDKQTGWQAAFARAPSG